MKIPYYKHILLSSGAHVLSLYTIPTPHYPFTDIRIWQTPYSDEYIISEYLLEKLSQRIIVEAEKSERLQF